MPLYSLKEIQQVVAAGACTVANQRAQSKLYSLGWTIVEAREFIACLRDGHFYKTYENASLFDGFVECGVDAYKMRFDEENKCESSSSEGLDFFIKIAIHQVSEKRQVAVVSFHLDGSP